MKELKSCVGIDISKDSFEVCIKQLKDERSVIKATRSFQNDYPGFEKFLSWTLSKVSNPIFVMETTGVYHEDLTHFLYDKDQKVSVVLANKMKHFAKSLNMKTKTDKADAQMIAQYGLERLLEWWKPMMPQMKNLRDLSRERLSLKKDLVRCKCQIHGLKHAHSTLSVVLQVKEQQISFLESNIQIIENEIIRLTNEDKEFSRRVKNIETIKGLRLLTIVTVLCETNGFRQFNNIRQVVSYAGLDIAERQSGLFKGKTRISKKGNARIRECLYMPALSATSYNEPIKALYDRVVERNPTILRKGITATNPKIDYNGREEFMIDAACFPGSSGSPVLMLNEGSYRTQDAIVMGSRVKLLGVLYAGPQHTATGKLEVINIPTREEQITISRIPNNLGVIIKAKKIIELEAEVKKILKQ